MNIDHEPIADGPSTSEQVSRRTFLNRAGAAAGVLAASAVFPATAAAQAAPSTSKLVATPRHAMVSSGLTAFGWSFPFPCNLRRVDSRPKVRTVLSPR